MGIIYSTNNFENIINIISNQQYKYEVSNYIDYTNIADYRILVYYSNQKDLFLFFDDDTMSIINYGKIQEDLLIKKSKIFYNLYELKEYIYNTKNSNLIKKINQYYKKSIDNNYINNI